MKLPPIQKVRFRKEKLSRNCLKYKLHQFYQNILTSYSELNAKTKI